MADGDSTGSAGSAGNGGSGGGSRSFTESDVERIVRDRLDRERRKQEEALRTAQDSSKSDIDKLTAAVAELTKQAQESKAELARRDVAEKYNLPKSIAAKLSGSAADDLDREARDWVTQLAELGVPVKDGKIVGKQGESSGGSGNGGDNAGGNADGSGKGGDAGGGDGKDGGGQGSAGGDGADAGKNNGNGGNGKQGDGDAGKGKSLLGGRPTETLRSGAAPAGGGGGDVDAGKLAESILGSAGF